MMGFISYYGHVQNTSNLGDNIFKSHTLGALVEVRRRGQERPYLHSPCDQIPAWSAPFIINRCGRRGSQATFFLLSTVFSCGYALICQVIARATCHVSRVSMQDHIIIRLVSGLLGRMTITAAYFVCLQVSAVTIHVSRYTCHDTRVPAVRQRADAHGVAGAGRGAVRGVRGRGHPALPRDRASGECRTLSLD